MGRLLAIAVTAAVALAASVDPQTFRCRMHGSVHALPCCDDAGAAPEWGTSGVQQTSCCERLRGRRGARWLVHGSGERAFANPGVLPCGRCA